MFRLYQPKEKSIQERAIDILVTKIDFKKKEKQQAEHVVLEHYGARLIYLISLLGLIGTSIYVMSNLTPPTKTNKTNEQINQYATQLFGGFAGLALGILGLVILGDSTYHNKTYNYVPGFNQNLNDNKELIKSIDVEIEKFKFNDLTYSEQKIVLLAIGEDIPEETDTKNFQFSLNGEKRGLSPNIKLIDLLDKLHNKIKAAKDEQPNLSYGSINNV